MRKLVTTYGDFYNEFKNNPNKNYYVRTHDFDELTKINAVAEKIGVKMLKVTFDNNITIECAEEHAFMNKDGYHVLAKDLKIHSRITTTKGLVCVNSIKKSKETTAYDISIDSPHWYVNDENGIIHHNTNLALVCVRAYLKKYSDAICIFYDCEGGATPEYLTSQGVDPERVIHTFFENLEELKFDIVKQLSEIDRGDKVIIVIDSIGNAPSLKEIEDAMSQETKAEMQRAKALKAFFRMITPSLVKKDIACIAISHVYKTMTMFSQNVISGGEGQMYACNQAFIISKAQEKEGTELVGWNFTINIVKSRFVKEKSKLPLTVLYESGISKYSGLLEIALEVGKVIKPSNGYYSRVDVDGVIEDKKWRAKAANCPEFWDILLNDATFKDRVKKKFKLISSVSVDDPIEIDLEEIEEI